MIDTGCRIDEGRTLKWDAVDFDNLIIKVVGKGNKERIVPMSVELRKILYKLLQRNEFQFVFATKHGGRLSYFNTLRDFKALCEKLGINGVRCSWHTLRHGYALNTSGKVAMCSRFKESWGTQTYQLLESMLV